ncbi:MAG: ABC transporter ATP-binding protein [Candidatus Promineifilaceae bacterium]|nr:ABC transporter ATP-binding protein [Candidatus Promineifilaceae bacterium]
MSQTTVRCQGIYKTFGSFPVVEDVSLQVKAGRILALLGPSGCGKTTTLRLIAGFEQLDSGLIEIDGQIVAGNGRHIPPEKRRAGMVFQDYALFPHLSVADNVGFGLNSNKNREQRIEELLTLVGLPGKGQRMPYELSGGQQQRVALARALAPRPAVLLLDEPFSNLDASLRLEVREEIKILLQQSGTTAVFVTHDQEEALFLGDEVAVMHNGCLEQIGAAEVVFHQPRTRFVAEFVGQADFIPGTICDAGVETPLGLLPKHVSLPDGTIVDVAVRADDVQLIPDAEGRSHVISRQFLGIAYMVKVNLPGDYPVHSWQSHQTEIDAGAAVQATIRPGHTLTCFYQGKAV